MPLSLLFMNARNRVMANRKDFFEKLKKIQDKYPELNKHQIDDYRCKYYGEVIDLYHVYSRSLEREIEELQKKLKGDE